MHKLRHAPGDPEEDLRAALESVAGPGPVYVLGLGYVDKADDGAGVLVAENLKKPFPEFSFSEHDGLEGTVLDISEKEGPATVFFVDGTDIGEPPGTLLVVPKEDIKETEISTHRVPVTLMASVLAKEGKRSAVVCIQIKSLEFRGPVTPQVSTAVDRLGKAFSDIMAARDI